MKINFPDGTSREVGLTVATCTGYIATSIELRGSDVSAMRKIFERNPTEFAIFLTQLEARLRIIGIPISNSGTSDVPYQSRGSGSREPCHGD